MFGRVMQRLTLMCGVAAALLAMTGETHGGRLWDCMFGAAPPSKTTYVPPYVPGRPAGPTCTPTCSTCTPVCVPTCTPTCVSVCPSSCGTYASHSCQYMPGVVSRSLFQPMGPIAYRPAPSSGGCATCYAPMNAVYPLTTYRPNFGAYQTRLMPYASSLPHGMPVIAGAACPSCTSCGGGRCGAAAYAPLPAPVGAGCSTCGVPNAATSQPAMGQPVMSQPATTLPSVAGPMVQPIPIPSTTAPQAAPQAAPPTTPRTFQGEADKPATGTELGPRPSGEVKPNSLPAPTLPDPNNRRVASAAVSPVQPASWSVPAVSADEDDGWRPAR